jgi:hypothetical protein
MEIPKEYIIKKSDAQLGTTNSYGYIKSLIGETPVFRTYNGLVSLINGHKPTLIRNIKVFQHHRFIKNHHKLLEYIKNIKIYSINLPGLVKMPQILWIDPEYEKKSILLRLFHYQNLHTQKIKEELGIEIDKLLNSLDLSSERIKKFYFHCITGILLGYRPSSIRGYALSSRIVKHLNLSSEDEYEKFQELDKKIIKKKYDESRSQYIKTPEYQVFIKEYPILKKKCDEWIEYMITDSKMFKSYYKECKKEITLLKI